MHFKPRKEISRRNTSLIRKFVRLHVKRSRHNLQNKFSSSNYQFLSSFIKGKKRQTLTTRQSYSLICKLKPLYIVKWFQYPYIYLIITCTSQQFSRFNNKEIARSNVIYKKCFLLLSTIKPIHSLFPINILKSINWLKIPNTFSLPCQKNKINCTVYILLRRLWYSCRKVRSILILLKGCNTEGYYLLK